MEGKSGVSLQQRHCLAPRSTSPGDSRQGRGFGFTGLHYHWNREDDNFRKTVLNGIAWSAHLEVPENGIETEKPTREFLEENILEFGGEQNRKKE